MPPQAAGISYYSVAEEIAPILADFLVERRGFELMAIAISALRDLWQPHRLESLT
jgi:hypothetical protein